MRGNTVQSLLAIVQFLQTHSSIGGSKSTISNIRLFWWRPHEVRGGNVPNMQEVSQASELSGVSRATLLFFASLMSRPPCRAALELRAEQPRNALEGKKTPVWGERGEARANWGGGHESLNSGRSSLLFFTFYIGFKWREPTGKPWHHDTDPKNWNSWVWKWEIK